LTELFSGKPESIFISFHQKQKPPDLGGFFIYNNIMNDEIHSIHNLFH